jgi:hypothetical protein
MFTRPSPHWLLPIRRIGTLWRTQPIVAHRRFFGGPFQLRSCGKYSYRLMKLRCAASKCKRAFTLKLPTSCDFFMILVEMGMERAFRAG